MAKRADVDDDYDNERPRKIRPATNRSNEGDAPIPSLHEVFHGEVAAVQNYGVFVKIPGYVKQGLVHRSQMSKARIDDPSEMLSVGEKVYCKVISIEAETKKIGLSMKVINQTTGQDMDPNNVEISLDERKKKKGFQFDRPRIELGAELDTICKRCGGRGHFAQDCYVSKGYQQYDLIPENYEEILAEEVRKEKTKKKKKDKAHKKKKKHKTARASSSPEQTMKTKKHKHHDNSQSRGKHHLKHGSNDS